MGRSTLIGTFFLLIFFLHAASQMIRFRVVDALSLEPVANVWIGCSTTGQEATTDEAGRGLFTIPDSIQSFTFQFIRLGYDTLHYTLERRQFSSEKEIVIKLTPRPLVLDSVVVQQTRAFLRMGKLLRITPEITRTMPFSQNDLFRTIPMLPSASAVSDYASLFTVRGATPDQHNFYLDDVPLLTSYRMRIIMGGGTSLFNTNLIQNVDFYPAHYPADYGGQGGALLVTTARPGRSDAFAGNFFLSPYETGLQVEGPLSHNLTFNTAGRFSYLDQILNLLHLDQTIRPRFGDWQGNLNWKPHRQHQFRFGWMVQKEKNYLDLTPGYIDDDRYSFLNLVYGHILYLRHQYRISSQFSLLNVMAFQRNDLQMNDTYYNPQSKKYFHNVLVNNQQMQWTFRQVFRYSQHPLVIRTGWELNYSPTRTHLHTIVQPYYPNIFYVNRRDTLLYLAQFTHFELHHSNWRVFASWRMDFHSYYHSTLYFSPRLGFTYAFPHGWQLEMNAGLYHQFPFTDAMVYRRPTVNIFSVYRLHDETFRFYPPYPERFRKAALQIRRIFNSRESLNLIFYFSESDNMFRTIFTGFIFEDPLKNSAYSITRNSAQFQSRGVEFWANISGDAPAQGWNAYLSAAYHYSRRNDGRGWVNDRNDFRWKMGAGLDVKLTPHLQFSTTLNYLTLCNYPVNNIFLIQVDYMDPEDPGIWHRLQHQKYVFTTYFRLDARLRFILSSHLQFYLEAINLTNHPNRYDTFHGIVKEDNRYTIMMTDVYNLPFLIGAGLEVRF